MEFIIDDFEAAEEFVRILPPKIKRERFSIDILTGTHTTWTPTHVVLVIIGGKTVAMADSLHSEIGSVANASIIALRGYGAYALKALLRLKTIFPEAHWESTLRLPTASTLAISRRFFDSTYDQGAWELSMELRRRHGPESPFAPFPIIASISMMKRFELPTINNLDNPTKNRILETAQNPPWDGFYTPNGLQLDPGSLMAIAFEIANAPMIERQHTTRLILLGMSAMAGSIGDPQIIKRIAKPRFMGKFYDRVRAMKSKFE